MDLSFLVVRNVMKFEIYFGNRKRKRRKWKRRKRRGRRRKRFVFGGGIFVR